MQHDSPPSKPWTIRAGEITLCSLPLIASHSTLTALRLTLSPDELDRANRFITQPLQDAFVIGRGVLRAILAYCVQTTPEQIRLSYGNNGKPHLINNPGLRFNLSHSEGHALFALTMEKDIGVDLEQVRPLSNLDQVAALFFSSEEIDELNNLEIESKERAFFRCWTRKEAYIKAKGEGLSTAFKSFSVTLSETIPPRLYGIEDPYKWKIYDISPNNDNLAAVVVEGPDQVLSSHSFNNADECLSFLSN